jgi:hypothetical protein
MNKKYLIGAICCLAFTCVNAESDYTCLIDPMDVHPDNRIDVYLSINSITFSHVDKFDKESLKSKPETLKILDTPPFTIQMIDKDNDDAIDTVEGHTIFSGIFFIGNVEDENGRYRGYYNDWLQPGMTKYKCNKI